MQAGDGSGRPTEARSSGGPPVTTVHGEDQQINADGKKRFIRTQFHRNSGCVDGERRC